MKRDAGTLRQAGEALFGPSWQTPLADALGVADRTMRRWAAGDSDIPAGVWDEIGAECTKRGGALLKLAARFQAKGP